MKESPDQKKETFPEIINKRDISAAPAVTLYYGDCLELMKDIPDKSIDMILCDPPYGSTACKWDVVIPFNKHIINQKGKVIYENEFVFERMKEGVKYDYAVQQFKEISKNGLWDEYKRIIKDRGCIALFGSEPFSSHLRMSNIKDYKYDWIWNKKKGGNPFLSKIQPIKITEIISIFNSNIYHPIMEKRDIPKRRGKNKGKISEINNNAFNFDKIYYEKYPKNIIDFTNANQNDKQHPTQKPTKLLEYLIRTYTLENETVLDNCMGSFSTAIACLNTKRNFIGIEKDAHYFQVGKDRLEKHLLVLDYTPVIIYNQV